MDSWYITKEGKVAIRHVSKLNNETLEWEQKEMIYELSEDGKTLKSCDEGEDIKLVQRFDPIYLLWRGKAGSTISLHEYLAQKEID